MREISTHRKQIMGFAALAIWAFHCWRALLTQTPLQTAETLLLRSLQDGTDIFFFLSGMGLVFAYEKSTGVIDFWVRRAERMLLPVLLSGVIVAIQVGWEMEEFVLNVSGINFYRIHIFSYSWFYAAIATVYLLFPAYYRILLRTKNRFVFTLGVFTAWLILTLLLRDVMRRDFFMAWNRIGNVILGVFAGHLLHTGGGVCRG